MKRERIRINNCKRTEEIRDTIERNERSKVEAV
jgi:hypothetical protein